MKIYSYNELIPDHPVWGDVEYWGFGSFVSQNIDDVVRNSIAECENIVGDDFEDENDFITVKGWITDDVFFSTNDIHVCNVDVNIADWKARTSLPCIDMADNLMAIFGFRKETE